MTRLRANAVAEALTNASKHGAATEAMVRVSFGDMLRLDIVDNGTGPALSSTTNAAATAGAGTGLAGLRERAAALGGTLNFAAAHDAVAGERGGRLLLELPLKEAE